MVRTKFQCFSKKQYQGGVWDKEHKQTTPGLLNAYEFQAVTASSPENNEFFASTPGGSISLTAVRDDLFVPGKFYYLTFEEATE